MTPPLRPARPASRLLAAGLALAALASCGAHAPAARADLGGLGAGDGSMPTIAFDLWATRVRREVMRRWVMPASIPAEARAELEAVAALELDAEGQPQTLRILKPARGPHAAVFEASITALAKGCATLPKLPAIARARIPNRTIALRFVAPDAPLRKESP